MKKIILIGGVPGTGKTTLAYQLALQEKIDKVISLDVLKSAFQINNPASQYPYLYTTTLEAREVECTDTITGYLKHCDCIAHFLMNYIERIEDYYFIIEGAQLNPSLIPKLSQAGFRVFYIHLEESKEVLLKRYEQKLKCRQYGWKDRIDIIMELQDYLSAEYKKIGSSYKEIL